MTRRLPLQVLRAAAVWISILLLGVRCQVAEPFEDLDGYPQWSSSGGHFTWPAGDTDIFTEGSYMTISWETDFPAVNLYNIYWRNMSLDGYIDGTSKSQVQLATGYGKDTFDWTVSCTPDCQAPFAFRIVDATGNSTEQQVYGFWSRYFWVDPGTTTSSAVASSTVASSASSATSSSSSSSTTSTAASTTPSSTTVSNAEAASSSGSQSNGNGDEDGSSANSTAIGAGVGVGVGVVALGALAAGLFFWRRRRNQANSTPSAPSSSPWASEPPSSQQWSGYYQDHPSQPASEVYGQPYYKPSEVPAFQDPHELPNRDER